MNDDEWHPSPREEDIAGIFTDLSTARTSQPQWVVEGLFPVGLTFLAAPPKAGKSSLTMAAACLVSGHKCKVLPRWISLVPSEGVALVFSAEAEAGELRHMCEVGMGLRINNNESILIADDPWLFRLDDPAPGGWPRMKQWLDIIKPKLVILDPLRDFHNADENDAGEMNRLLRPIRQWAMKNEAAFVVVHHTKKPGDGHTHFKSSDMRGTSALFGIADGAITCTPIEGKPNALHVEAIFKKAKGWSSKIQMAIYENKGEMAGEVLSPLDTAVLFGTTSGVSVSVVDLAATLKKDVGLILKSLKLLERNGAVKCINNEWSIT